MITIGNLDYITVNKNLPCPICGRTNWCLVEVNGTMCICPRISAGSVRQIGRNGCGWLHNLTGESKHYVYDKARVARKDIIRNPVDFTALATKYYTECQYRARFALKLGITTESLRRLLVGWTGEAETWPMKDDKENIIGIRLCSAYGKYSVRGSKNGLFWPLGVSIEGDEPLLVTEGRSDPAAAISLGFDVIGRAGCTTGFQYLVRALKGTRRLIVIMAHNDPPKKRPNSDKVFYPGQDGAKQLASDLTAEGLIVKVVIPTKFKDLREGLNAGVTHDSLVRRINRVPIFKKQE